MNDLPSYISEQLEHPIKTRYNKSDINAKIWVSRPSTVLLDNNLLERQAVLADSITDISIAVCHPKIRKSNTEIYIAYISNGIAKVQCAKHKIDMSSHEWIDTGFSENASSISIAFDGTMPKSYLLRFNWRDISKHNKGVQR